MFPHDKLDWALSRLQRQVQEAPDDAELRLKYVRASISKGHFHAGGDQWFNEAVNHGRRALHLSPGDPEALVLSGLALALLDRPEPAERFLADSEASKPDAPELHFARAILHRESGEEAEALHAFEAACRLAPESWECHMLLGQQLARQARSLDSHRRLVERAQFHLVRALELGPSSTVEPALLEELGALCLQTDRIQDAHRVFVRLHDHEAHRASARYQLGRVAAGLGKYKKAIVFYRQYLSEQTEEHADVWTRIGAAYLHLQEPARAREACNRALASDPGDLEARWILGSALVAEDQEDEAVRVFRELLELAPDRTTAFAELVRLRTRAADLRWLRQALRSETAVYDRLPVAARRTDPRTGRKVLMDPRHATRSRIGVLVDALGHADDEVSETVLGCLDLTTDEGLRFLLWEKVLEHLAGLRAEELAEALETPGDHYGTPTGHAILSVAHLLEERALVHGLQIGEEDLRRAAVARNGPTDDVAVHRRQIAEQRAAARSWQALLLLGLASKNTPSGHNLLVRWAADADEDLSLVAKAGLALQGDAPSHEALVQHATGKRLDSARRAFEGAMKAHTRVQAPTLVTDNAEQVCACCGRRGSQVAHMLARGDAAVCSVCLTQIAQRRHELATQDPRLVCALSGATLLDTDELYVFHGVPVASSCIEQSLGHHEREAIDRYLAALQR